MKMCNNSTLFNMQSIALKQFLIFFTLVFNFYVILAHTSLNNLGHRHEIAQLCEEHGLKIGVELGVQRGEFSKLVLENWPSCEKYILVDIWAPQKNYIDSANVAEHEQRLIWRDAHRNTRPWEDKVIFMKNTTLEAASITPDESVDFVYVDARHDYCGVKEDLEAWWPKLRKGGLMAGHDYLDQNDLRRIDPRSPQDWSVCGDGTVNPGAVKGAVKEFAMKKNLEVFSTHRTDRDGPYISWIFNPKGHENMKKDT